MLCLSQTTGYAIKAMSLLHGPGGTPRLLRDIAADANVPYAYLAKRMPDIAKANLVSTKRGLGGGILLKRPPNKVTLLEISEAIESRQWLDRCLLGLETCSDERSCPTHHFWKTARKEIEDVLIRTTLADVAAHEIKIAAHKKSPEAKNEIPLADGKGKILFHA